MRCVGTGFVALDIIRSVLDVNTLLERRHAGGSCGNVLADLAYLGVNSSAVGRIGDDAGGAELISDLRQCNVDVKLLAPEQGRRTPIVIQETFLDSRGRPRHRFSRACPVCGATMAGYRPLLAASVEETATALPPHQFFYFDRVARGTLELARHSYRKGAFVVFEPSGIKDENLFVECLRVSHVFKYSEERPSGVDALVAKMRPPLEVKTLGEHGLQFRLGKSGQASRWTRLNALPAPLFRDSAGSGDWCTAGLIARLAKHEADPASCLDDVEVLIDALRFGQALAALNCAYDGARGLMYALSRAKALKAIERLEGDDAPRLPDVSPPPPLSGRRSRRSCVVCASDLRAAQA